MADWLEGATHDVGISRHVLDRIRAAHEAEVSSLQARVERLEEALTDIATGVDQHFIDANGGYEMTIRRLIDRAQEGLDAADKEVSDE